MTMNRKDFLFSICEFASLSMVLQTTDLGNDEIVKKLKNIDNAKFLNMTIYFKSTIKTTSINSNKIENLSKEFDTDKPLNFLISNKKLMVFPRKSLPIRLMDVEKKRVVIDNVSSVLDIFKAHNGNAKGKYLQLSTGNLNSDEIQSIKKLIPTVGQTKMNNQSFQFEDPKSKIDFQFRNVVNLYFPNGQSFAVPINNTDTDNNIKDNIQRKILTDTPLPPEILEDENFKSILIDIEPNKIFPVKDLMGIMENKTKEKWHIDIRLSKDKIIFIADYKSYNLYTLVRIIEKTTRTSLRKVGNVYFFSMENLGERQNERIADSNKYKSSVRRYLDALSDSGNFDSDLLDIYSGKNWSELSDSGKTKILKSIQGMEGVQGDLLRSLIGNNGNIKAQMTLRSDVIISTAGGPVTEIAPVTVIQ
jgi:hypothetical protein